MKIIIALCGLVALACAEIATSNKHHSEHERSVNAAKQSLQERLAVIEGSNQGSSAYRNQAQYGNSFGASGSEKYVSGCIACIGGSQNHESHSSSRQSSSSQRTSSSAGHGISSSDYAGVGTVGHIDDVQSTVLPGFGSSSRYSSANDYEAEDTQQRVLPADLAVSSSQYRHSVAEQDENDHQHTVVGSGLNTYSQRHGDYEEDDDVQRTVGSSGYIGGDSQRSHSQSRGSQSARTVSTVVPIYTSGTQQRVSSSQSQSESELSESRRPVHTGQYISMSTRPGTATVLQVPVRVIQTTGVQSVDDQNAYQVRTSEHSSGLESGSSSSRVQNPTSTTYRVTYNPATSWVNANKLASSSDSENTRTVVQQPEKLTNYNKFSSGSQSRFRAEDVDSSQVRVAPVTVSYPTYGGSSRVASSNAGTSYGTNYNYVRTPIVPVSTVESSSSSRTAEEREQRRYNAAAPTYITSGRVSVSDSDQAGSTYGSTGSYVIPVSGSTRQQTQSQYQAQSGSGSQSQFQRAGTFSPYVPSYSQTSQTGSSAASSDRLATRFGAGVVGQTDDLHTYMSESERLARLQQQQIAGTSSGYLQSNAEANRRTLQTASNLDNTAANFVGSASQLSNRNSEYDTASVGGSGAGAGGYNRVKSWNKQSKWSSGSEYGTDGKPKSYSTLSTAEAEKYNINGAETGYKAATTTLENDGKVSTYSIHTP